MNYQPYLKQTECLLAATADSLLAPLGWQVAAATAGGANEIRFASADTAARIAVLRCHLARRSCKVNSVVRWPPAEAAHGRFGDIPRGLAAQGLGPFRFAATRQAGIEQRCRLIARGARPPAACDQRVQEIEPILLGEATVGAHLARTPAGNSVSQKSRT